MRQIIGFNLVAQCVNLNMEFRFEWSWWKKPNKTKEEKHKHRCESTCGALVKLTAVRSNLWLTHLSFFLSIRALQLLAVHGKALMHTSAWRGACTHSRHVRRGRKQTNKLLASHHKWQQWHSARNRDLKVDRSTFSYLRHHSALSCITSSPARRTAERSQTVSGCVGCFLCWFNGMLL